MDLTFIPVLENLAHIFYKKTQILNTLGLVGHMQSIAFVEKEILTFKNVEAFLNSRTYKSRSNVKGLEYVMLTLILLYYTLCQQ